MSLEAFQLNGKSALGTGSRRGLGAAIAVALAMAGANVGCHGHDANPGVCCDEIYARSLKTLYFSGDLADSECALVLSQRRSQSLARSTFWCLLRLQRRGCRSVNEGTGELVGLQRDER
jgi:hypothetical protein